MGIVAATRVSYSGYNDLLTHGLFDGLYSDYDTSYGAAGGFNPRRPAEASRRGSASSCVTAV